MKKIYATGAIEYVEIVIGIYRKETPARILSDGVSAWFSNGMYHRGNDLPAVLAPDDYQAWYLNGERHRALGPAIVHSDGYKAWWLRGAFLRESTD